MDGDSASLIMQLIWLVFFFLIITGLNQKIQTRIWILDIKTKLNVIMSLVEEDRRRIANMLRNLGVSAPDVLINRVVEFFTIEPVSLEPTDIIKRLDHLVRTTDESVKKMVESTIPHVGRYEKTLIESSLSIVGALNTIYKIVRHYLLTGERENNWILIMQLQFQMPMIMKIVNTYHEALDAFTTGKPIGDAAGPLTVHRLIENGQVVSRKVIDETSIIELYYKDRRVFVVKAEGPGSNVGHPGAVLNKLVEDLKGSVDLIVTIDAALKLEGEETGSIAEGVGAAIGDPGPEKIAIERAASKYNIPLRALVIKMDLREAITVMRKEIFEACYKAHKYVDKIIEEETKPKATVIVAGIGNTMGVPG